MARARVVDRLHHVLAAIARIEARTVGRTFDDYAADWVTCDVVERNLERISEASRRIPDELKAGHPQIRWRPMADLGNVLRHAYDRVADVRIWQIVTDDLPPLKVAVEAMLREVGAGDNAGSGPGGETTS